MAPVSKAARIVDALLEDDELDRLTDQLDPDEFEPNSKISFEVDPCHEVDGATERIMPGEPFKPEFWTVYKRIHHFNAQGMPIEALAQAVEDFPTHEQADAFAREQIALYRRLGRYCED